MSVIRDHDAISFECDECGDTFEPSLAVSNENFHEVWNEAKDEGWQARKDGGDWTHQCPECRA